MSLSDNVVKPKLLYPALLILLVTLFFSHFDSFTKFGLYEDDYAHIVPTMGYSLDELISFSGNVLSNPLKTGRPLSYVAPAFLTMIGFNIGGLPGVYLIGYLIISLNTMLVFFIFLKSFNFNIAFLSSLLFVLYPADVTKIFLSHSLVLHVSLMFCLSSILIYNWKHKVLSYLTIIPCLFYYESVVLPFFLAPILNFKKKVINWNKLIVHIAIVFSIIISIIILRYIAGDPRFHSDHYIAAVNYLFFLKLPLKILKNLFLGPVYALKSYVYAFFHIYRNFSYEYLLVILSGSFLFGGIIYSHIFNNQYYEKTQTNNIVKAPLFLLRKAAINIDKKTLNALWIGLVLFSTGYLFSFKFNVAATFSRSSRVHFVSVLGAALFIAAIIQFFLEILATYKYKLIKICGCLLIGMFFSFLVCYARYIQDDFVWAWNQRKLFWREVLELCPDVAENTRIFVINEKTSTKWLLGISRLEDDWSTPVIFSQLFKFPSSWESPPRLFIKKTNWITKLNFNNGKYSWKVGPALWDSYWEILDFNNLIVLKILETGHIVRQKEPIVIDGKSFPLKMKNNAILKYPQKILYNYLAATPILPTAPR